MRILGIDIHKDLEEAFDKLIAAGGAFPTAAVQVLVTVYAKVPNFTYQMRPSGLRLLRNEAEERIVDALLARAKRRGDVKYDKKIKRWRVL